MKKSDQTIQKITDFFISRMQEKDYDKITVKEISEGLGIQRSTFYMYFQNTRELKETVEEKLLGEMHFYVRSEDRMALDLTPVPSVEAWFAYGMKHRDALMALLGEHGDPLFEKRFREKICAEIHEMMDDEGMPKDGLRPFCVELYYAIHFSLFRFSFQTMGTDMEMTAQKLAGLANNWRAAVIVAERRQGIPITREEYMKLYASLK